MQMTGYTKLFSSILASSVWRSSLEVKVLWITLLAMADKNGIANASIPGLASMAGLSIETTEECLEELLSPDKYSRTTANEGRRIEAVEGGWRLLNHAAYRSKMGADERREYLRIKQAEFRAKRKLGVNNGSGMSTPSTHAEADTEAKAEAVERKTAAYKPPCPSCGVIGSLQRTPPRNGYPAGWWCRNVKSKTFKGNGCGENFPLATPEILEKLSPVVRREVEKVLKSEKQEYVSPGLIITSELKFDKEGRMLNE